MAEETSSGPPLNDKESASGAQPVPQESVPRRVVRPRYRRPKHFKSLLALGALLLIAGGFFLWRYFDSYESTDDAQVDVHLYPVSARVSGYVTRVNVDDNQYLNEGTVLVEIDPKDYEVAVEKAKADLANAEATAQSLNINVPITSVNTSSQLSFLRLGCGKRAGRNPGSGAAVSCRSCTSGAG